MNTRRTIWILIAITAVSCSIYWLIAILNNLKAPPNHTISKKEQELLDSISKLIGNPIYIESSNSKLSKRNKYYGVFVENVDSIVFNCVDSLAKRNHVISDNFAKAIKNGQLYPISDLEITYEFQRGESKLFSETYDYSFDPKSGRFISKLD